jgi:CheY-like chemotaxis protein
MSKNSKILIVDDDKFLLNMYREKFVQGGFDVDVAVGSEEALAKLRGGDEPDVLILDIIMPGVDGLELLEMVRKENLCPKSQVVMLTNENDKDSIDKAKSLGVAGYIVKATSVPSEVVEGVLEITNKVKI